MSSKFKLIGALALSLLAVPALAQSVTPVGSASVTVTPSGGLPTSINPSSSWVSPPIPGSSYRALAATATSSQPGAVVLQRYADSLALAPVGSPATVALTANVPASVVVDDGTPFMFFTVTITNTNGATTATLTNVYVLKGGF